MQNNATFEIGDIVTISFQYAEINKIKAYLAGRTGIVTKTFITSEKPFGCICSVLFFEDNENVQFWHNHLIKMNGG